MPRRYLIPLGAACAGLVTGLPLLLLVILPSFGSDAPTEAAPSVLVAPDEPPLLAAAVVASPTPLPRQGGAPEAPLRAAADACARDGPEPLSEAQVLSYYGSPYTADMGILGELPPAALLQRLQTHARSYDALNGETAVRPAFHIVYATAQSEPQRSGSYLLHLDDETLQEYIDLACENGLLVFLDLQIGHSDVETEVRRILPYLEFPHVNVALDPEFAMAPGEIPGESIGSLDAADINAAQAILDEFLAERELPDKILVVHQFTPGMLTRPELLDEYERVKLVIDMDGFGPSEIKRVKYGWFAAPAEHSGIKLFFRQDPDLMSDADVLALEPDVIIYQ
jgi:hypothetical protein